jgi:thiamine kinase-like enzyme
MELKMKQDVMAVLSRVPIFADLELSQASLEFIGGATNRSYRVALGERAWVVRIPGVTAQRLVDRSAERRNAATVAELGLTIPDLWFDTETGIKVSRWVAHARPLSQEDLRDEGRLGEIAALLRRLHGSRVRFETAFSPHLAFSRGERLLLVDGHDVPAPIRLAAESYRRCRELLDRAAVRTAPCHQDLWRENLIQVDGHLLLLDWEHSAPGDPVYDLADFAVQANLSPEQEQSFLEAYFQGPPEPPEFARFWMSKALSHFAWGAWGLTRAIAAPSSSTSAEAGARKIAQAMEFMDSQAGRGYARVLESSAPPRP